jgi:ribosomal protein S2
MENGGFRVGVISMTKKLHLKFSRSLVYINLKVVGKNLRLKIYKDTFKKVIRSTFSLKNNNFIFKSHIGHASKDLNSKININLIGLRNDTCFFNIEKSVESLQTAGLICKELSRLGLPFLFVNVLTEYNEMVKMTASAAYQPILLGEFAGGSFTNSLINLPTVLFFSSSKEHFFSLKEAHKLNLPTLSINDSDVSTDLSSFPIFVSDDSLEVQHGVLKVVSQSLIKGCLFHYVDSMRI